MKGKKVLKTVLCIVLALAIVVGGALGYLLTGVKPVVEEPRQTETENGVLKVGILSDMQLTADGEDKYSQNYKKALELFKSQNVNVILNIGDFTDVLTKEAMENHKSLFDSVYLESEREQLSLSYIFGNHDYWLPYFVDCWEIPFTRKMHNRFTECTYAESPWTHKVVNGYHFIAVSPDSGGMSGDAYSEKTLQWAEEQIQAAVADNPQLPVFVLTHHNPEGTVYTSKNNGCENLDELFKKYPQVVSFSGHSHAPLMDEAAIYQKEYTAINTQCTSYVCFAEDANCIVHDDGSFIEDNPMVMIMELKGSQATVQRYSVLDGKAQKSPWIIDAAAGKDGFAYTDARKARSAAPVWSDDFTISAQPVQVGEENTPACQLTFTAAQHTDMVRQYRAVFKRNNEPMSIAVGDKTFDSLTLISDFSLPAEQRSEKMVFNLPAEKYQAPIPAGQYTVELYAQDAFGNESAPQTAQLEIAY